MAYLIKRDVKVNEIVYFKYDVDGYIFKPNKNSKILDIKEVKIIKPSMIEEVLNIKFEKALKKILEKSYKVFNEEDEDASNASVVLGEVERLKAVILNNYKKYLSKRKELVYLKKLKVVEDALKLKIYKYKEKEIEKEIEYMVKNPYEKNTKKVR